MVRSLWTSATGMIAQQFHMDTIAHNLSNVNTTGYKKNRVDFEDLLYQHQVLAGTPSTPVSEIPVGVNVGVGVRPAATQKIFQMGSLQSTGHKLDLAISSDVGFFKILLPDGTFAYQRNGDFKIDSRRQVLTSDGYPLEPPLVIPPDGLIETLTINEQGEVRIQIGDDPIPRQIGQIELYRFVNPAGLKAIGKNLFKETPASGPEIPGTPGLNGFGSILQGFLEMSNVNLAEEMVNMIVAQRAYEANSKSIQTSDSMLSTAIQLKRG
ncbi:MAG: flagellar basal-body rod protein FlgG [Turneriella sp.]|nr:flagellar basal-body rod protein FlgG [Leptospiraceae bacterium]MCX7631718.1 flagellar basal-body rod protein FlgG [Turneriella sp.]